MLVQVKNPAGSSLQSYQIDWDDMSDMDEDDTDDRQRQGESSSGSSLESYPINVGDFQDDMDENHINDNQRRSNEPCNIRADEQGSTGFQQLSRCRHSLNFGDADGEMQGCGLHMLGQLGYSSSMDQPSNDTLCNARMSKASVLCCAALCFSMSHIALLA